CISRSLITLPRVTHPALHSFPTRRSSDLVPIILYDVDGHRAGLAAETLEAMGYQDVRLLDGGLEAWAAAGGRTDYGTNVPGKDRSEEHTSELQSRENLVCRLLLEKKKDAL